MFSEVQNRMVAIATQMSLSKVNNGNHEGTQYDAVSAITGQLYSTQVETLSPLGQ